MSKKLKYTLLDASFSKVRGGNRTLDLLRYSCRSTAQPQATSQPRSLQSSLGCSIFFHSLDHTFKLMERTSSQDITNDMESSKSEKAPQGEEDAQDETVKIGVNEGFELQIALDQFLSGESSDALIDYMAKMNGLDPKQAIIRATPASRTDVEKGGHTLKYLGTVDSLIHLNSDSKVIEYHKSIRPRDITSKAHTQPQHPQPREPPSKTFEYSSLDPKTKQIRLLRVSNEYTYGGNTPTELTTFDLDVAPEFYALSYVWGKSEKPVKIYCNDGQLNITVNLAMALNRVFSWKSDMYLWADGICINQENAVERASQVMLMGKIYRRASKVLAHLHHIDSFSSPDHSKPEQSSTWSAISLMNYLSRIWNFDTDFSTKDEAEWERLGIPSREEPWIWNNLLSFWTHDWFTRAWVLQEAVLGSQVLVFFGDAVTTLDQIIRFWDLAQRRDTPQVLRYGPLGDVYAAFLKLSLISAFKRLRQKGVAQNDNEIKASDAPSAAQHDLKSAHSSNDNFSTVVEDSSLLNLLSISRPAEATDKRDKIYSLLGIAEDDIAKLIKPDYSVANTVADVYLAIAEKYMEKGLTIELLQHAGLDRTAGLPSFVPDWSHEPRSPFNLNLYNCSGNTRPSMNFLPAQRRLVVRGAIIDSIRAPGLPLLHYSRYFSQDKMAPYHIGSGDDLKAPPAYTDQEVRQLLWNLDIIICYGSCSKEVYPGRMEEALASTLTADCTWSNERTKLSPDFFESVKAFWSLYSFAPAPPEGVTGEEADSEVRYQERMGWVWKHSEEEERALKKKSWPFEVAMQAVQKGRRICTTAAGYMGTFTNDTEHGDLIAIFEGFPMPFVIRPEADGFLLVGNAYVHGIMDSELICKDVDLSDDKVGTDKDGSRYGIKMGKDSYAVFQNIVLV